MWDSNSSRLVNIDYNRLFALKSTLAGRALIRMGLLSPLPPHYRSYDLRRGIPFQSNSVHALYCSHLLEHFDREEVPGFVGDVFRVLVSGGIFRVVVPDLEGLVQRYLRVLQSAREHLEDATLSAEYDDAMYGLFDQLVRRKPGGHVKDSVDPAKDSSAYRGYDALKKKLSRLLFDQDPATSGELHRWMYDSYSLARLLVSHGFVDVVPMTFQESRIEQWAQYYLDSDKPERENHPGSLYMEATKP